MKTGTMIDARLHDYSEENPSKLLLNKPIVHPNDRMKVIGHVGTDVGRDVTAAAFPRRKNEHWFRGKSTNGLTGYGISIEILDHLNDLDVERVLIVETDNSRVVEYELSEFKNATMVAFSPEENESVIGDEEMRIDSDVYSDHQRVIPVHEARRVFDRNEVRISK